jgi:hypothetical protein
MTLAHDLRKAGYERFFNGPEIVDCAGTDWEPDVPLTIQERHQWFSLHQRQQLFKRTIAYASMDLKKSADELRTNAAAFISRHIHGSYAEDSIVL